jgi:hypothetical protein
MDSVMIACLISASESTSGRRSLAGVAVVQSAKTSKHSVLVRMRLLRRLGRIASCSHGLTAGQFLAFRNPAATASASLLNLTAFSALRRA